jgi:hypothetical protein
VEADLARFRDELINDARVLAASDRDAPFTDQAFAKIVGDRLVAAEELGSFEPCHVRHPGPRNTKMKLDGFEWDEDDDSLRLIVTRFSGGSDPETINKAIAETEFKAVRSFVDAAVSGWCRASLEPA